MTLSIMGLDTTLSINVSIYIQHINTECHYAECDDYLNVVVMLNVVMLNVIMLCRCVLALHLPRPFSPFFAAAIN